MRMVQGIGLLLSVSACGAGYAVPTQRMADAQAAQRSAKELGADKIPEAQLHLKLAEEQIAKADASIKESDNRRADYILVRAKADAELALAIAKEKKSMSEAQMAAQQAASQKTNNVEMNQGAH